jgi:hypothetical protein
MIQIWLNMIKKNPLKSFLATYLNHVYKYGDFS